MALFQINYHSAALARSADFYALIPNDTPKEWEKVNPCYGRPPKTLMLLHGYSGSAGDWLYGSPIQELSLKYNLAVVMPSGDNTFYLNGRGTGRAYETYVGEELIGYVRETFDLSKRAEDTYIAGLSMGGYGALHTAFKYPLTYGKAVGLSSALIVEQLGHMTPEDENPMADYDYYTETFGDLKNAEKSDINPKVLVRKLQEQGTKLPGIFMACGTEDFLIEPNRNFRDFLIGRGIPVCYYESAGVHDWTFWREYLEPAIQWMLEE